MRDFELERTAHAAPRAEQVGRGPEHVKPGAGPTARADAQAPGLATTGASWSPRLDVASVMHLQRTAGNASVVQLLSDGEEDRSPVHDVVGSGGGQPLDKGTQSTMEASFGRSFEDVRVHTGGQASKSAESVGANAYTVGSNVVFREGQYNPSTPTGQRTLAHELAHVVQQSSGPVDGTAAPGGIRVSDPSDRFERAADSTADHVMSSVQASSSASASAASAAPTAQLEEDDSATPAIQREAAPEEEEEQM